VPLSPLKEVEGKHYLIAMRQKVASTQLARIHLCMQEKLKPAARALARVQASQVIDREGQALKTQ
jgi:hypothetical protein